MGMGLRCFISCEYILTLMNFEQSGYFFSPYHPYISIHAFNMPQGKASRACLHPLLLWCLLNSSILILSLLFTRHAKDNWLSWYSSFLQPIRLRVKGYRRPPTTFLSQVTGHKVRPWQTTSLSSVPMMEAICLTVTEWEGDEKWGQETGKGRVRKKLHMPLWVTEDFQFCSEGDVA